MKIFQGMLFLAARISERTDWAGHFTVIEPERVRMRPLCDTIANCVGICASSQARQLRPVSREVVYAVDRTDDSRVAFCGLPNCPTSRSIASAAMKQPFGAKLARSYMALDALDRRKPQERRRRFQ
jgi:hypothetical protein